jgi:hypothetical protein
MRLQNLFGDEKYLKDPMADGESDYSHPGDRAVGVGAQRGDGDQLRKAYDRDLMEKFKKISADIQGHGGQMYVDNKLGYYRLEFGGKTIKKFSIGTWKNYSLSLKTNLFKNALRIIIKRIEDRDAERLARWKVDKTKGNDTNE